MKIGRDNSIIKYRVRIDDDDTSEIIVYFDEAIGMPVKQEFYSVNGEEKTLRYAMEIVNFRTQPDDAAFTVPAGFAQGRIKRI